MKNLRGREALDTQAAQVKLHNNSSAKLKARNNSLERQIMLDDECVIVENDRQNKFRHDWEAQQYKKSQQQIMNEINSQMIIEKKKEKKKQEIAKKNPVQVDSDIALSLINNQLLRAEPPVPVGKVSFII